MIGSLLLASALITADGGSCVHLSALHTGGMTQREAAAVSCGNFFKKAAMAMAAVAIQRDGSDDLWLIDSGLGAGFDKQMEEAPWWLRLSSGGMQTSIPARDQLGDATARLKGILLTHIHYDHTSGLPDFPGVTVHAPARELEWAKGLKPGEHGVLPGLVKAVEMTFRPVLLNELSGVHPFGSGLDFFGDGSLILIAASGHTPGSLIMLARGCDDRKWLFVGDEAWLMANVDKRKGRPWFVRWAADVDADLIDEELRMIAELAERTGAKIVPAHDRSAYEGIPNYPEFTP